MAHRTIGIDPGSYSVKVAEVETGLRTLEVRALHQVRVAVGGAPPGGAAPERAPLDRAIEALAALREQQVLAAESVYVAMPGDRVLVRLLELPFSDPKRVEQVIGYELEGQIAQELDELLFDHLPGALRQDGRAIVPVAAARTAEVEELLRRLPGIGLDPRGVTAAPFAYPILGERLYADGRALAWVDVGHRRTNVCVEHEGRARFARTISAGGHDVTEALRRSFQVPYAEAEGIKHEHGSLLSGDGFAGRVAEAARAGLAPLARELRVSLAAAEKTAGVRADAVVLCGGGSRLGALAPYLTEALGVTVEPLVLDERAGLTQPAPPETALALACALRDASKRRVPEFRRGPLAYRGDVSFVRSKVRHLVACAVAVLGFAVLDGYAALHKLRTERAALSERLRGATRAVFGQELLDPALVRRRLAGAEPGGAADVPRTSAFDWLTELSRQAPPGSQVKLDVLDLDIRPRKTQLKATIDSAASVDLLVDNLRRSECVGDIQKGRITDVSAASELKQFTLTVDTKCF